MDDDDPICMITIRFVFVLKTNIFIRTKKIADIELWKIKKRIGLVE